MNFSTKFVLVSLLPFRKVLAVHARRAVNHHDILEIQRRLFGEIRGDGGAWLEIVGSSLAQAASKKNTTTRKRSDLHLAIGRGQAGPPERRTDNGSDSESLLRTGQNSWSPLGIWKSFLCFGRLNDKILFWHPFPRFQLMPLWIKNLRGQKPAWLWTEAVALLTNGGKVERERHENAPHQPLVWIP